MVAYCVCKGCHWRLDCAHMDDAIDHLKAHFRALHPTKALYERDALERLETFNRTADEIIADWNLAPPDQPENIDWRHLRADIRRYRQYEDQGDGYLNLDALVELEAKLAEWEAANPQPQRGADVNPPILRFDPGMAMPQPANPFVVGQDPGGVLAVDEAAEFLDIDIDDEF